MDQCLRVNSPRQLYKPYFGSTQRPSSPGLLATNDVEQIGDTVSLMKRGIELPRESDMAVRMMDVAPADREWDRGSHSCNTTSVNIFPWCKHKTLVHEMFTSVSRVGTHVSVFSF